MVENKKDFPLPVKIALAITTGGLLTAGLIADYHARKELQTLSPTNTPTSTNTPTPDYPATLRAQQATLSALNEEQLRLIIENTNLISETNQLLREELERLKQTP